MKLENIGLFSLILCLISSCSGVAPAVPTASTSTAADQNTGSSVEFVWSTMGDPNPFKFPDGIGVDPQGNLYVMDSLNNRVQKFDSDGQFLTTWGTSGNGAGEFQCLNYCMLAVDRQGNVYVTDIGNARVQKFDSEGKFLKQWGSSGDGDGQFSYPFGIAVDQNKNVYIGDVGNTRIQVFDDSGIFVAKWGTPGYNPGQFSSDLADIAVDSKGNIYVTDRSTGVSKFNHDRQFLTRLEDCGDAKRITSATGIAVDVQDNLYVFDLSNSRVCKFDPSGKYLDQWDGSDSADGAFTLGGGVAVDQQGNVYVSEPFANRIRKYRQR
jgi:tripartite motif-containing protein 71